MLEETVRQESNLEDSRMNKKWFHLSWTLRECGISDGSGKGLSYKNRTQGVCTVVQQVKPPLQCWHLTQCQSTSNPAPCKCPWKSSRQPECLAPCHPHGRSQRSSWLLVSTRPSRNHCSQWGDGTCQRSLSPSSSLQNSSNRMK